MAINTKELARLCGVSRTTVSRALNDSGRINPQAKRRILEAAKENGYRPDLLARSLVKGTTMCLGIVVFDIRNYYFAQMVNSIEMSTHEEGYFVNITLQEKKPPWVDGIVLCPVNKGMEFSRFLQSLPVPVIVIGNYISDKIPFIGIDERLVALEAMRFLCEKGYERIVFVCPPLSDADKENIYTHEQRALGVDGFAADHPEIAVSNITVWNYLEHIDVLTYHDGKMALLCSGDVFALDIIRHIMEKKQLDWCSAMLADTPLI